MTPLPLSDFHWLVFAFGRHMSSVAHGKPCEHGTEVLQSLLLIYVKLGKQNVRRHYGTIRNERLDVGRREEPIPLT